MKGIKSCYICGKVHHKTMFYFPKDFPNKFKWCCRCLGIAEFIITRGYDNVINLINDSYKSREKTDIINRSIIINELITIG